MDPKELRGLYEAYKKVNAPQDISEISANLALTASQKADEERRKAAISGDKERAAEKAAQASRLYKGVGPRRAKERMAEGVRGKKKGDGNLANNYPPYDEVTRGDIIAAAKGEDQMGGKRKVKEEAQQVDELYKGKHGQSEKEYADSRSQGGKMVSGTSKMSGAEYTHGRRVKAANPGMQPDVGGKTKPKSQGKMDRGTRADLEYRKANLKKEELEATGLFTAEEIERILDIMCG